MKWFRVFSFSVARAKGYKRVRKGPMLLFFLAIFAISCCSMFAKQLLLFLPNLPSSLLSFVLLMMKLSKSIHYMEYELMIKNL